MSTSCIVRQLTLLTILAITLIISACGGGSGSSSKGTTADNNQNDGNSDSGDTLKQPPTNPLSKITCESIVEYEWENERCMLKSNPAVDHLELIEALPEKDRADLLTWLDSLEKVASFNSIFPHFYEDTNSNINEPTEDQVPPRVLDSNLLKTTTNEINIIEIESDVLVLGQVEFHGGTHNKTATRDVTINDAPVAYKKAAIHIDGGNMVVSLYDKEVYRFKMISSLSLEAHISHAKNQASSDEINPIEVKVSPLQDNAAIDGNAFVHAIMNLLKPDESTLSQLQSHLQISDEFAEKNLSLTDNISSPILLRLNTEKDSTPFFSKTASQIYVNRTDIDTLFSEEILTADITVLIRSTPISGAWQTERQTAVYFDTQIRGTVASRDIPIDDNTVEHQIKNMSAQLSQAPFTLADVSDNSFIFNPVDELKKRMQWMQDSSDVIDYSSDAWEAYPNYSMAAQTVIPLSSGEATFVKNIAASETLLNQLLTLASPNDYGNSPPDREAVSNALQWDTDLARLLTLATKELNSDSYTSRLNTWLSVQPSETFYSDLSLRFSDIFEPLTQEEQQTYGDSIISMVVNLAYRGQLYNPKLVPSDTLVNAIQSAGTSFAPAVRAQIDQLGTPDYSDDENTWQLKQAAVDAIEKTPRLLTPTNKALIATHDETALLFSLPLISDLLFSVASTTEVFSTYISSKNTALNALNGFYQANAKQGDKERQELTGIKAIAERAYNENWQALHFDNLKTAMTFNYPRSVLSSTPLCDEESVLEQLYCYSTVSSAHLKTLSTTQGKGYLATYPSGAKPFIENASLFVQIESTIKHIDQIRETTINSLKYDFLNALKKGLWFGCTESQVGTNITEAVSLINTIEQQVEEDPYPVIYSDNYDKQQEMMDQFETLVASCPAID